MGYFGKINMGKLSAFWLANTDQTLGQKTGWKKAFTPKEDGLSRKQTESITFLLGEDETVVTFKMQNGKVKHFSCGTLNPSRASTVGKEFAVIMDGEKTRAGMIAKEIAKAGVGDMVVLTHESVTVGKPESEEEEEPSDTPEKPRIGIRRVGRVKKQR